MDRRDVLTAAMVLSATGFIAHTKADEMRSRLSPPTGPVTFYLEFRVAPPENPAAMSAVHELTASLAKTQGFLHLSLKQMVGDSTMVKNYPESYKGILADAYLEGLKAGRQPYFYALFIRFADYNALHASGAEQAFPRVVGPHLRAVSAGPAGPVDSLKPMAWYQGIFETIAVGNRASIIYDAPGIATFLRQPADGPELTTVANHVFINEADRRQFDRDVVALLKVAQETFQPNDDANQAGMPGTRDNRWYRKAVSTEILRNAFPDGSLRAYLMHGVWDSVWDHENSHLDPRFQRAAEPVGQMVVIGPVEPFYRTMFSAGAVTS